MLSPTRGVLRGLRAASLSIVGFVLALVAHAAAGGVAPGPVALLLLAGLVGLAAVLLTGGRLGPVRVGVSLTTMQVVLHEVFMRLGTTGMAHTGMTDSGMAGTGMAEAGMTERSLLAATAMVDAHVAAIAVIAVLLAYGEKGAVVPGWVRTHAPVVARRPSGAAGSARCFFGRAADVSRAVRLWRSGPARSSIAGSIRRPVNQ